ncbi:hypothetical protein Y1Q_0012145 [Alligator mississippiensis]|uniref:Uncharacterized protein n=1 Tax=Alligator mississippiensis TaxID=8496 RepID=A0A151MHZ3_ALLMI|nr:hypothetical protein Y1Q_0012145 [Alligator mississippiensis]
MGPQDASFGDSASLSMPPPTTPQHFKQDWMISQLPKRSGSFPQAHHTWGSNGHFSGFCSIEEKPGGSTHPCKESSRLPPQTKIPRKAPHGSPDCRSIGSIIPHQEMEAGSHEDKGTQTNLPLYAEAST